MKKFFSLRISSFDEGGNALASREYHELDSRDQAIDQATTYLKDVVTTATSFDIVVWENS